MSSVPMSKPAKYMPENLTKSENSRNGICGLQNLGNTCFMNSGLQCLSNTRGLTRIFLADLYQQDLNPTNSIGTGCKLVKAFATLMKEMWLGTQSVVSPWYFKRELGDFVPQFYGYQQQDSHELVTYTLDLIHEDLNRVKVKPKPEEIETEGLTEAQLAQRSWEVYLSRNQSHVVELMHGQLRSQVTCPDCGNVSVTFDPFASISVSFSPKSAEKAYEALFVPFDSARPITKFRMKVFRGGRVRDLKEAAAHVFDTEASALMLTKAFSFSCIEPLSDELELVSLSGHLSMVMLETMPKPLEVPVLLDIYRKPESRYTSKGALAYTRVLMIAPSTSLLDVHLEVYRFLQRIKRLHTHEEGSEPSNQELHAAYTRHQDHSSPTKYLLNLINLQREKLQFGTSVQYSSSSYTDLKCDFCQRKDCYNCPLPSDSDVPFAEFIQKNTSGRPIRLEVILPSAEAVYLKPLTDLVVHPSITEGDAEERRLREQSYTLEECLSRSGRPEKLDAENEVYCSKCKKHVQADKQMQVYRLPKVLILHLKRFKQQGYRRDKDERLIRFPLAGLDMAPFICGPASEPQIYDLYAVSNHYGGLGGGHYTAYAKNAENSQWYSFNDSSANKVEGDPATTIVSPGAYVLFYERREAQP